MLQGGFIFVARGRYFLRTLWFDQRSHTSSKNAPFRYSPEFKFRPAASPVVREKLKDGRTRVRGGRPGDDIDPPVPIKKVAPPVKTKRKKKRRAGGTF
jgi:hypothetical protein